MAYQLETTAVQRALSLPEILSAIFMWIDENQWPCWQFYDHDKNYPYGREGVLIRCALVNKLWYNESMRCLWSDPSSRILQYSQSSLPTAFGNLDPGRRQFYANFVKTANLITVDEADLEETNDLLRGVAFPKLKLLRLIEQDCAGPNYVPRIGIHRVRELDIDVPYDCHTGYGVSQDDMDTLLEQIPVRSVLILLPALTTTNHVHYFNQTDYLS